MKNKGTWGTNLSGSLTVFLLNSPDTSDYFPALKFKNISLYNGVGITINYVMKQNGSQSKR